MNSLSKPSGTKRCSYCRIHKFFALEAGHGRPCKKFNNEEHLKNCYKCRQNAKKTETVRKHREAKRGSNNLIITIPIKKDISEYLALKKELDKSTDLFSLMVYPYNYPQIILFQNNVDMLISLIDDQPSTAKSAQFQYRKLESGACKIVCLNKETRDRFLGLVKRIRIILPNSGIECPLFVIPENETFKHLHMSCILNEPITGRQFLTSTASNNRFETSRWECDDSVPIDGGHKVNFAVDPIVYRYMLTNDLILRVKDQEVKANLELNPFLAYMFEEYS